MEIEFAGERHTKVNVDNYLQALAYVLALPYTMALWSVGREAIGGSLPTPLTMPDMTWERWYADAATGKLPESHLRRLLYFADNHMSLIAGSEYTTASLMARGQSVQEDNTLAPARIIWQREINRLIIYDESSGAPWGTDHMIRWIPQQFRHLVAEKVG